jgi:hypothetical protein
MITLRQTEKMASGIKDKIHELVNACNDPDVLEHTLSLLTSGAGNHDWWLTLNAAEQERTVHSLEQANASMLISHEEVMNATWEKLKK